jgi:hypothetical protein
MREDVGVLIKDFTDSGRDGAHYVVCRQTRMCGAVLVSVGNFVYNEVCNITWDALSVSPPWRTMNQPRRCDLI